jgi:hypothetical protein
VPFCGAAHSHTQPIRNPFPSRESLMACFDFESGTGQQLWWLRIVINGWSTKALSIGLFKRPTVQLDENRTKNSRGVRRRQGQRE